jgi:hypothetical protein
MIGSTYKPSKVSDFEATKLNFDARGVSAVLPHGVVTDVDLPVSDDALITGAWLVIGGATHGDKICFQVVDVAGTMAPAGTVLNQFITDWYPSASTDVQIDMAYPAKVYSGLTLRVRYTSIGSSDAFIAVNYKLHKVLV